MGRINTAFVWNSSGNTEHMKQQCKIRARQCEQYTLFIGNQFILASLRLRFIMNLILYKNWPACGKWDGGRKTIWIYFSGKRYLRCDIFISVRYDRPTQKALMPVSHVCFASVSVNTSLAKIIQLLRALNCVFEEAVLPIWMPVLDTHSGAASVTIWMVVNSSWGERAGKLNMFCSKTEFESNLLTWE